MGTEILMYALQIVGMFLLTGLTWLVKKSIAKWNLNELQGQVLESIAVSVDRVYKEGVEAAKKANTDGKLSDVEKKQFQQMAINYVKGDLKGQSLKAFEAFGKPKIDALISSAVNKAKK